MCIVMLVSYVESTADMIAVGQLVDKQPTENDIARGLPPTACPASWPAPSTRSWTTAFAQNVGLVQVTRVRSRFVVTAAGIILALLGLIPQLGEIIAASRAR